MIHMPSFMKIGSGFQKLIGGKTNTKTGCRSHKPTLQHGHGKSTSIGISTPYSSQKVRSFGGTCRFHLRSLESKRSKKPAEPGWEKERAELWCLLFLASYFAYSWIPKMEEICSSETSDSLPVLFIINAVWTWIQQQSPELLLLVHHNFY
jgi:hypothetical protein